MGKTITFKTIKKLDMKLLIEIRTSGDFTEKELTDFVEFELGGGSLDNDNPFIDEDGMAEITRVDADIY